MVTLRICESQFLIEDTQMKGYSFTEIDVYAWIPPTINDEETHRLTIQKNITENKYELFKFFEKLGEDYNKCKRIVIFSSESLKKVLDEANNVWNKYHNRNGEEPFYKIFDECDHDRNCSSFCKLRNKKI